MTAAVRNTPGAHQWMIVPFAAMKRSSVVSASPVPGTASDVRNTTRLASALGMRPIGMRRTVAGDEPCETWTFDRLDEIARSFSRYGTAPAERFPAEPTDVAAVVHDVVELERRRRTGLLEV